MASPGYIYALINPSMPGLVKVGRTARNPVGRAAELSSATGVASAFVVGYHAFFADCEVAERQVHIALEARGLRVSKNREFFQADLSEVVSAIAATLGHNETASIDCAGVDNEILAEQLLNKGLAHLLGNDEEVLEDEVEGLRLLSQAAMLGNVDAMLALGDHYALEVVMSERRSDSSKAIGWFKEAAERGSSLALGRMAQHYTRTGELNNARKCWRNFLSAIATAKVAEQESEPGYTLLNHLQTLPVRKRLFLSPQLDVTAELASLLGDLIRKYEQSVAAAWPTFVASAFPLAQVEYDPQLRAIRRFVEAAIKLGR